MSWPTTKQEFKEWAAGLAIDLAVVAFVALFLWCLFGGAR